MVEFDSVGAVDGCDEFTVLAVGFMNVVVGGGRGGEFGPGFVSGSSKDELKLHQSSEWTSVLPCVDPENPTNINSSTYSLRFMVIDKTGDLGFVLLYEIEMLSC